MAENMVEYEKRQSRFARVSNEDVDGIQIPIQTQHESIQN